MPLPEQSRYTPPPVKSGQVRLDYFDGQGNRIIGDQVYSPNGEHMGTKKPDRPMSLEEAQRSRGGRTGPIMRYMQPHGPTRPAQRLSGNQPVAPRSNPARPAETDVAATLERTINRLPFFPEYERRVHFPSGTTSILSTVPEVMELDFDGPMSFAFEKYETWTDVVVRIELSGNVSTADTVVTTDMIFRDQANKDWPSQVVSRFNFDQANVLHFFAGRRRVPNLPPGRYTCRPRWWVTDNTFRFTPSSTMFITVTEAVPIPTEL